MAVKTEREWDFLQNDIVPVAQYVYDGLSV